MNDLSDDILLNIMKYSYNPSLYCINTHFNELYKLRFKYLKEFQETLNDHQNYIFAVYYSSFDDRSYLYCNRYSQCIFEMIGDYLFDGYTITNTNHSFYFDNNCIILNKELIKYICRVHDIPTINTLIEFNIPKLSEFISCQITSFENYYYLINDTKNDNIRRLITFYKIYMVVQLLLFLEVVIIIYKLIII
jgi:hypothetical protein